MPDQPTNPASPYRDPAMVAAEPKPEPPPNVVWVVVDEYGNTVRVAEDREYGERLAHAYGFRLFSYELTAEWSAS